MLKFLRHRGVQRKIFIGLAIAIIPSFVMVGVMTREDSKSSGALGKIGPKPITVQDYLNSYRAIQHQMQFMFGERWTEMRRYVNMKGEAWDRILLLEEARHRGIRASDEEVVKWIAEQAPFQREGKYYPELYRMAVRDGLRMEPRDFEEEMRKTLTVQKLSQKIISGIQVSDADLKELYQKEHVSRDLEYVVLAAEPVSPTAIVDEKEIQSVYEVVKERLTQPERVRLSFITIPKEDAESKKDILADNTSTIETLSAKASLPVKTTAFFSRNDSVPEIGLSREVLSTAFALSAGSESPWIAFEGASFKIKVDEKQAERTLTVDESREDIRKQILNRQTIEAAVKRLADLKPAVDKDGLAAVAQAQNLKLQTFDSFKVDSYIPEIGPGSNIAKQVAALKENETSMAIAVTNGAAIVRVKKDHAPDDAAFEKEKEAFKKEALGKRSQDAIKDLLEKLRVNLTLDVERMKEIFPDETTANS